MKNTMRKACCAGLCLALAGNGVSIDWQDFKSYPNLESYPEEKVVVWRQDFKNPEILRDALKHCLVRVVRAEPFSYRRDNLSTFKEKFDVQDEVIRAALMSIYREAEQKLESMPQSDKLEYSRNSTIRYISIAEMGAVADEPMKLFLLERVRDGDIPLVVRSEAIKAYLRCADAQEAERIKPYLRELVLDNAAPSLIRNVALATYVRCAGAREARDIFTPFLAGKETLPDYVMDAVQSLQYETDEAKREVVRAFLWVAAAQAEDWQLFTRLDNILIARNDTAYFRSQQRLALLERHSISEPMDLPSAESLRNRLGDFRRMTRAVTSVSTNLAEFMERDFSKPAGKGIWAHGVQETNAVQEATPEPPQPPPPDGTEKAIPANAPAPPVQPPPEELRATKTAPWKIPLLTAALILAAGGFYAWRKGKA